MCTRITYAGLDNIVLSGRSMDWRRDMGFSLWVFPRGLERNGAAGPDSLNWRTKFGSVVTSGYDSVTTDGMNEKGLAAGILYLSESQYPKGKSKKEQQPLSVSAWAQYVLDNFSSVEEAVKDLQKETFYIAAANTPDGEVGTVHLTISDASGDSAIFEYIEGHLFIHHGKQYQVTTNSPFYQQQLALDAYWQEIGGSAMLPGTSRAADRFVRASYYNKMSPKSDDIHQAIAIVYSIIRNASTPFGISSPDKPNIAPTLWRTLADQKNKRYYFESTQSPFLIWLDLCDFDLAENKPTKKFALEPKNMSHCGNVGERFVENDPFAFLAARA